MTRATAAAERLMFEGPSLASVAHVGHRAYHQLWSENPDFWSEMFEVDFDGKLIPSPAFERCIALERDAIERARKLPKTATLGMVRALFAPEVMAGRARLIRSNMIDALERLGVDGFDDACECSRFMQSRVMRAIIDTADYGTWITCASASRIARAASCSRMAVQRALPLLVKRGFIARVVRHDPRTGARLPNVYVIASYALIAAAPPTKLPKPRSARNVDPSQGFSIPRSTFAASAAPAREGPVQRTPPAPAPSHAATEPAPSSADAQLWTLFLDVASADRGFRIVDDLRPRDRRAVVDAAREMIALAETANVPEAWPWTARTMDRAYRAIESKHLRDQSWALKWIAGDLNAIKAKTREAIRARAVERRHVEASLPPRETTVEETNASRIAVSRSVAAACVPLPEPRRR